jgi:hypothetical protein
MGGARANWHFKDERGRFQVYRETGGVDIRDPLLATSCNLDFAKVVFAVAVAMYPDDKFILTEGARVLAKAQTWWPKSE